MSEWVIVAILIVMLCGEFMERNRDKEILAILKKMERILCEIAARLLEPKFFRIFQIGEDGMPTDNSIVAGSSGNFSAVPQPAGSQLRAGVLPQWVASDPAVGLSPSADGLSVDAAVPAGDVNPSFTLAISYARADGASATGSVTVTIVQPTPPPPPEPTSFSISQNS